jgi:HEPN domain-containing protein
MKRGTRSWIKKAEGDLRVARNEAAEPDPVKDAVGFHCQQAAEKYLKALLCDAGLAIPRIHDLDRLLVLLLPHHAELGPLKRIPRFAFALCGRLSLSRLVNFHPADVRRFAPRGARSARGSFDSRLAALMSRIDRVP